MLKVCDTSPFPHEMVGYRAKTILISHTGCKVNMEEPLQGIQLGLGLESFFHTDPVDQMTVVYYRPVC